jgi:Protein of unknown function (DUF4230)
MKHVTTVLLGILGVFAIGLALGVFVPRLQGLVVRPPRYQSATLLTQVQAVSELVTVKYIIERVVEQDDVKWIAGLGENRVLLLAHGIVKAGIDLSKLTPSDLVVTGRQIRIKLPAPRITEAYLDEKQTRVIERTTGLLRSFDKDLEQRAREHAITDIESAALEGGILKDARRRARAQLTLLLKQLGFQSVKFE